jgi:hypothetical protein
VPRLLLLSALVACGYLAACGGSRSDQPKAFTIQPITVQGHAVTRVVILPGAIKTH